MRQTPGSDLKSPIKVLLLIGGLFIIYLAFPTANSTMDGLGYAGDVLWRKGLFHPHHLLYTYTIFLADSILPFGPLATGKIVNALAAAGCLWVLYQILLHLSSNEHLRFWLTAMAGCSFATMRFATENETYILPVFFSLLGTYHYIQYIEKEESSSLLFSGIWLSVACLYHQLHFFWWLCILIALLIRNQKFTRILYYAIPAFIVPLAYFLVLIFYRKQIFSIEVYYKFVFESFFYGTSAIEIKYLGILRFIISLIRTFLQIHATSIIFLKNNLWLGAVGLGCLFILFGTFIKYYRQIFPIKISDKNLFWLIVSIIATHLAFALVSLGNSEFMVMIPFLISMLLSLHTRLPHHPIRNFTVIFFIWNLTYGLIPQRCIVFSANESWAKKIALHPYDKYFMRNNGEISNYLYLFTGNDNSNSYFSEPDAPHFKQRMDSLLQRGVAVYTDYFGSTKVLNTQAVLYNDLNKKFYDQYVLVKADSASGYSGEEYLYRVLPKK